MLRISPNTKGPQSSLTRMHAKVLCVGGPAASLRPCGCRCGNSPTLDGLNSMVGHLQFQSPPPSLAGPWGTFQARQGVSSSQQLQQGHWLFSSYPALPVSYMTLILTFYQIGIGEIIIPFQGLPLYLRQFLLCCQSSLISYHPICLFCSICFVSGVFYLKMPLVSMS